jgi:hypothetical protein
VTSTAARRLASGLPAYAMAMLACLVVVGLVLLITPRRNEDAVPRVDYRGDLAGLTAVAPYTAWAPRGLPPTWQATSSRLTGTRSGPVAWHLGFYTPQGRYAALEESNERGDFIARMTSAGRPDGALAVGGATWQRSLRADKNQRSLVLRQPGVTLVVTGTASYGELAALAGSLRPAS